MTKPYTRPGRILRRLALLALAAAAPLFICGLFLYRHSQIPQIPAPSVSSASPAETSSDPTAPPTEPGTQPTSVPTGQTVDPQEEKIMEIMGEMSLSDKIYQLFIVTPEQLTGENTVTEASLRMSLALEQQPVGGLIFFKANLVFRDQTAMMLQNAQSFSRLGMFLAVDEEGGMVARLGSNPLMGTTKFPNMGSLRSAEEAFTVGETIGREIRQLGFNLDFAPVADVNSNPDNPVIGQRSFSSDPQIAGQMTASCVRGFRGSGMICTLKHFPGHGDTQTDSHYGVAQSLKTREQLAACELIPFRSGIDAGAQMVMVGHISLPNVTGNDVPATLSGEIVTGLLRGELGYQGVVVTDSMIMRSITDRYSSGEAAVMALRAGVDMILIPKDLGEAHDAILDAVEKGSISPQRIDESVQRILRLKQEYGII